MYASFNRFEIRLTKEQALSGSHPGPCDEDIAELLKIPAIKRQLDKLSINDIWAELKDCGAWSNEELENDQENRARILWIACGNIREDLNERSKK